MIPDRTIEEKSYVSLARNHGYQVRDVQEKEAYSDSEEDEDYQGQEQGETT